MIVNTPKLSAFFLTKEQINWKGSIPLLSADVFVFLFFLEMFFYSFFFHDFNATMITLPKLFLTAYNT